MPERLSRKNHRHFQSRLASDIILRKLAEDPTMVDNNAIFLSTLTEIDSPNDVKVDISLYSLLKGVTSMTE